jgi:hypothetical protein
LWDCVVVWNSLNSIGIPRCQNLTDVRKKALVNRLVDIGGIDGWRAMCDRIRGSPHLRGENDRGWTATFDWVLKPQNLTKIMEGNYDDKGHRANENPTTAAMRALRERVRKSGSDPGFTGPGFDDDSPAPF